MYQALGTVEDQKRWLAEYGPVVATFQLYADLGSWTRGEETPVYKVSNGSTTSGNHIALVVGYDDGLGAWIMKNSWGPNWGDKGFVYFAYGEANIDGWTKYGITNVNPDPWSRKRHQSGSMMQSGNGETHRNFELLLASNNSAGGGFVHVERDGSSGLWSVASRVGEGSAPVGQPVIVGTSSNRDLAAVFVDESQTLEQWSYSQANKTWMQVSRIEDEEIDGFPAVTQDDDSTLLMVVRHADGTLKEVSPPVMSPYRVVAAVEARIGTNITQSGPSLVVSNIGRDIYSKSSSGNIYVVAVRSDGRLQLFSRPGNGTSWSAGEVFASGVGDTPPVMIQDFFDTENEATAGGLQLVVAVNGGIEHWRRDNGAGSGEWEMVEAVGKGVRHVWGLVQGSFGGKMHMVTEGTDGRVSYWEWDETWRTVDTLMPLDDEGWRTNDEARGG
ncbi:hypothetical protein GE09DRAFT_1154490 [Coniochaeta sp. 2T2.1]|nr:hypothetical protein GE09DRAFT_1154490 [Coniochaeta sp. 2T2.1]